MTNSIAVWILTDDRLAIADEAVWVIASSDRGYFRSVVLLIPGTP